MAEMTVVERVRGKYPTLEALESWAMENWSGFFDYMPKILVLSRGWFVFKFITKEDAT